MLCGGDDGFTLLAYFSCESCGHADFAEPFAGEDVVSLVEDEDVLQLFARGIAVLAQEQHGVEEEKTEEALLVVAKSVELKDHAPNE